MSNDFKQYNLSEEITLDKILETKGLNKQDVETKVIDKIKKEGVK